MYPVMPDEGRSLARTAGLRDLEAPQLEDVDRRRSQLWLLSLLVGLTLPAAIVLLGTDWLPAWMPQMLDLGTIRVILAALIVSVLGYVAERERMLRQLTHRLVEERVLTASLVSRVEEVELQLTATRALNSTLDLPTVLQIILASACDLLRAGEGSIQLLCDDPPDHVEVVAVHGSTTAPLGQRQPIGHGLSGTVAHEREPLLVSGRHGPSRSGGRITTAMVVPLQVRDELVGVLNLASGPERPPFTRFDLRSVSVFAETAAAAINNARAFVASQEAVAHLTRLDHMKDEFLSMVAHELRTPLAAIIGVSAMIGRDDCRLAPAQVRELAGLAGDQGMRLDRLVRNLVQVARIADDGLPVRGQKIDARSAVENTVKALRRGAPAHVLTLGMPTAPLERRVDPDVIAQILTNLVENAARHTPPGTTVAISLGPRDGGLALVVADDGPGIPAVEQPTIFDKFHRGRHGCDAGGPGLGLGLYLVRSLAEAHGGTVRLDSQAGRGCRFEVTLAELAIHAPRPYRVGAARADRSE